ncbi:uncharacterized protein LOC132795293 [Drosophila nasuta]|uniref:uncharacterized protein LOC132795293 n=1 Tax=Drosophila nasuta TaxID=42062 RepID=UPI00295E8033|nr:uncharacterized protein LOC132795293 [Drosophila nasuta]
MRFLLTFLTIYVVWLQLPQAEARKKGYCCLATLLCYSVRYPTRCTEFPNGKQLYYGDPTLCYSELCGGFKTPTPCCGKKNCDFFCCNCKECRKNRKKVAGDFREMYYGRALNVFERATLPKLPNKPPIPFKCEDFPPLPNH